MMSKLNKLVEEYFAPRPRTITKQMLHEMFDEVLEEDLFYQDPEGALKGPISSVEKVAQDIIKYIKRKYPHNYHGSDLSRKGGSRVIKFTNFGNLQLRDKVIRDMTEDGFLRDPEVKRSQMFHRATTNFVETTKNKVIPLVVQFDAGGGAATSGGDYEEEMEKIFNDHFQANEKPYSAEKQGGSTNNPDIVVFHEGIPYTSFEAKTKLGSDFGQFQIHHDGKTFTQKTQTNSVQLTHLFGDIEKDLNQTCALNYDPEKSGDLMRISIEDLGERVEKYYQEKDVDYIVVDDMIYASSPKAKQVKGIKNFKDAVTDGYVRIRVKCHGKSYSTTAGLKFKSIEPSINYYDVLDLLFP